MIPRRSTRSLLLTAASRVSRLPSAAATNPAAALLRPPPDTSESESGPFRSVLSSFLPFSPLRVGGSRSFAYWSSAERVCVRFCKRRLSSQARVDAAGGEVVDVPLAQTGEGIAECELLKWFVSEGDIVEEFQRLCEVQSDKATIEITSRFKGKVVQMLCIPGDIVKVGETLVKIQVDDSQTPFTSAGDINVTSGGVCLTDPDSPISPKAEASGGVLSTPAVRNLAKELGLVLNDIPGTGKDGRILKEDVLTYATSKGHCKEQSFSSDSIDGHTNELELLNQDKGFYEDNVDDVQHEDKIIPVRGFQRSMVKSMTMAAKVPHFHYVEEINFDALVELKAAFQTANKDQNVKHTYLPFLIKSLSMALNKYPLLNSSFNDETNEIFLKGYHNIGIAMATTYGLVVPNIKKVQSLTILEITKELARLQQMASSNKLNTEDITGGTLTLSNIGAVGGKFGSPLLNLPEVAIIAIGQIQRLPRFDDDDNIYPASVASVTVGADHRIVDGATVARFCNEWKLLIEKPELLLLHMK
ncbi:lipoamide acyltransferase component of branched-chain alpha-keto acid dehydrogenase complex, mitochondrial-like [Zingiber officinale]|uniref:lipoamide acyltransferase component of branched-chain alpha-keto acid dehydrogenase complex, mitochondrial-like n=1 Tax=Zingiber officinale TaxID=94328 RepID=UPI001C4AEC2C|nr:lipoamide acyltransferase component of branched-chain alpha-keto acid dehydrogenase complex, mitochondrial-like [Zingiber officinale]